MQADLGKDYNPEVRYLKRVGRVVGDKLQRNGIHRLLHLLSWLPSYYVDPAWLLPIDKALKQAESLENSIYAVGRIANAAECFSKQQKRSWFEIRLEDKDGKSSLAATWSTYSLRELETYVRIGDFAIVAGRLEQTEEHPTLHAPRLIPLGSDYPWPISKSQCLLYPIIEGFSYPYIKHLVTNSVAHYRHRIDFSIDQEEFSGKKLMLPSTAFQMLHLDWPCDQIELLNSGTSPAHDTVRYLRQHLPKDS